jgi:hypothetical protein
MANKVVGVEEEPSLSSNIDIAPKIEKNQNNKSPGFVQAGADYDDYSSDGSVVSYGNDYIPVHNIYEEAFKKQGAAVAVPPILWTTNVFDAKNEGGHATRTPAAVYHDDKPSRIVLDDAKKRKILPGSGEAGLSSAGDLPPVIWTGCVFEVSSRAIAHFPVSVRKGYPPPPRNPIDNIREWRVSTHEEKPPPRRVRG